ncbi:hypothetical protein ACSBR1_039396 [Camellia fascicularis]
MFSIFKTENDFSIFFEAQEFGSAPPPSAHAVSTEVQKETPLQKYSISRVKKIADGKAVVCRKQNYEYAVFYCHKTDTTKA